MFIFGRVSIVHPSYLLVVATNQDQGGATREAMDDISNPIVLQFLKVSFNPSWIESMNLFLNSQVALDQIAGEIEKLQAQEVKGVEVR